MKRRLLFMPAATMAALVLLAACGGTSATSAPTGIAATPEATEPSAATSPTPANSPTSAASAAPGASQSAIQDPVLAAKFPHSIDGQPVDQVQTGLFSAQMQAFDATSSEMATIAAAFNSFGIDFSTLISGTAHATVDGEDVVLQAVRMPNNDANKLIQNYPLVIAALDNTFGSSPPPAPTMTQTTIGGKNVTFATDGAGDVTTLYAAGDTAFILQSLDDSQTAKILQALP